MGVGLYDKNGNIKSLWRDNMANTKIDQLSYTYANAEVSNQLLKVEDSSGSTEGFKNGDTQATEYTYDGNGNMLRDYNKGITTNIIYNHLNLPSQITFANGKIEYFYDAIGTKQKKKVTKESVINTTDYAANYIYQNNALQMINQPEGYMEPNGQGGYDYTYQYKDHLGNIRLSYKDISTTSIPVLQILEENNYYPFGLKHKGYNDDYSSNRNAVASKFKYNGKELNDELGLDLYDYGARMYDPAIGRWNVVDPLADKYPNASPYCYALNNPITYIDPDGREVLTVSTAFTASFGGSAFREKGVLFDFSGKNVQIYTYKTNGFGTETNASLAIEGLAGYYPTATAQDLAGFGTIKNFSAGEVLFGSTSQAITSNGKKGVLVGVGFNIGALPFAYGEYSTNTTISPYNQSAKEYALLTKAISRAIETIDAKLDSFNNEIGFLNKGIGRTSQAIQGIDSKLMNSNLSEEARLELIQERSTLYNAREDYFKRGREIQQTTRDLKSQREQLNEL